MTIPTDTVTLADEIEALAKGLPADVRRWVLRGGAVPDAVWFGKYSYLKRMSGPSTWSRTELCERLAAYLRRAALGGAG